MYFPFLPFTNTIEPPAVRNYNSSSQYLLLKLVTFKSAYEDILLDSSYISRRAIKGKQRFGQMFDQNQQMQ